MFIAPAPVLPFVVYDVLSQITRLLVVLISLVVNDVEELELVDAPRGGDDAQPVTELHLLQELLGPVAGVSNHGATASVVPRSGIGVTLTGT